jgi:CHAD domain-containing protein
MERSTLSVALLRQRLVSLLKAMPAAQAGDQSSVHAARVASRRLREALPVLGASADERTLDRAEKRVRRLTRALGPVRELDVTLLLLAELEAKGATAPRAIERVREKVNTERLARRSEMLEEITPTRLDQLCKRLVKVAAPDSPAEPPADALVEAAQQAGKRARKLRSAIEHAGSIYLADRLHRVRIAAKKLRYALEIQRELAHSRATARLTRLKAQQELLGRMHDLEILIDRTRAVQEALPAGDRTGMAELAALVRALEDECREGHACYLQARPAMLKLCEGIIATTADGRPSAAA